MSAAPGGGPRPVRPRRRDGPSRPGSPPNMPDDPSTPTRDEHDNDAFSPQGDIGEGYPEESPTGANPDEEPQNPTHQPQRREGGDDSEAPND